MKLMVVETLAGAAVAGGALAYAVRSPRSSLLAPSVYRGTSARRSIALTFDDGPSESTPALLEILEQNNARATFFQCGANVRRLPNISRSVAESGHEIGNHTDSHPLFPFRSPQFILAEIEAAQQSIQQASGATPRLFRAPFGVRWFGMRAAQRKLGLTGVMWTVIGLDWKLQENEIAERLIDQTGAGGIVCLHDGRAIGAKPDITATLGAMRCVLPRWIDQGFTFETVSQILCPTN